MAVVSAETWETLRSRAHEAMTKAYAPYSRFPVGVAALVDDGRFVAGANVENAYSTVASSRHGDPR